VEGIGQPHPVAQLKPLLARLLLFRWAGGVGFAHLREQVLIRGRGSARYGLFGHLLQQAALDDFEDLVLFDGFAERILAADEMVQRLKELAVLQRFAGLA